MDNSTIAARLDEYALLELADASLTAFRCIGAPPS
jgi:hypothetical protein